MQCGLYDPARGGGLWFNYDYGGHTWVGPPAGGPMNSGTPGSLASYMTLLAQDRLVSPTASQGIRDLLDKDTTVMPTLSSPFEEALEKRFGEARVFEKIGVAAGGVDECAYIEWPADGSAPEICCGESPVLRHRPQAAHRRTAQDRRRKEWGCPAAGAAVSAVPEGDQPRTNDARAGALTSRRFRSHFEACGIRVDAQNSATVRVRGAGRRGRLSVRVSARR